MMQSFKLLSILFLLSIYPNCGMMTAEEQSKKETSISEEKSHYLPENQEVVKIDTTISLDYLMGKFDPEKHKDFVKVAQKYASRSGFMLRKEAYGAFQKMFEAAEKDGINLKIISATRPFAHQKRIWEAKWEWKQEN